MRLTPRHFVLNDKHPLARGLVAAAHPTWEGLRDVVTKKAAGTRTGTLVRSSGRFGVVEELTSNGADDRVRFAHVGKTLLNNSSTIAVWTKVDSVYASTGCLAEIGAATSSERHAMVGFYFPGNFFWAGHYGSVGYVEAYDGVAVSRTPWYHVVGVWLQNPTTALGTMRLYVNGRLVASSATGMTVGCSGPPTGMCCFNAAYSGAATPAKCAIADVRCWNRALSYQEIANAYADPWGLYRAPRPWSGSKGEGVAVKPWLQSILSRRAVR